MSDAHEVFDVEFERALLRTDIAACNTEAAELQAQRLSTIEERESCEP